MTPSPPEVEIVDFSKRFGAVQALDAVSVRFTAGRMHALLGENGAGKSTLVKCLMGYYQADAGRILVDRQARAIAHPYDAHALGLGMVYQHFTLVPQMSVAENFVLGRERLPAVLDWAAERSALQEFMARMPFRLDPRRLVATLAAGEKQKLEILKQLYLGRQFLVLDEPTSVLTPGEADEVLGEMRRLADARELTVVLITHKLREVMEFAQDVTILRGGKVVARIDVADASEQRLAAMMFGQSHETAKPELASRAGPSANYSRSTTCMRSAIAVQPRSPVRASRSAPARSSASPAYPATGRKNSSKFSQDSARLRAEACASLGAHSTVRGASLSNTESPC
jgi:general nucleoside transport system ATP-binding protein